MTQSYDKMHRSSNSNTLQMFDHTTVTDRHKTIKWIDTSHRTGMLNLKFMDPTLPTFRNSRVINRTHT